MQTPPLQHPLQFDGPHPPPEPASGGGGVAQAPPWQVAGLVQAMQARPPEPHFRFVWAVTHWVPSQQPLQFDAPQLAEVQTPCRQLWPAGQTAQVPPSAPQAPVALPSWQAPPVSTQPWQTEVWQAFAWQDRPAPHAWQAAPPRPQFCEVLPPRQKPLVSQQPLQLAGLQPPSAPPPPPVPPSDATHAAKAQAWPGPQVAQVAAPAPQPQTSLPGWHSPFASQQPLQLDRRQGGLPPVGPQDQAAARVSGTARARRRRRRIGGRAVPRATPTRQTPALSCRVAVAIAFFDLDRTLISANSGRLWIRRELALGHLSRRRAAQATLWIAQYHLGLVSLEDTVARAIEAVRGTPRDALEQRTRSFYEDTVKSLYRPGGLEAVRRHREAHDSLVLLTASLNYLADLAAKDLGFGRVLCNRLEVDAQGLHTGRTTDGICFGPGKLRLAQREADARGTLLSACTFYTDSYSDLAVLEAVGRPVVVNPDVRLRRLAKERAWETVDWGAPVGPVTAPGR